MIVNVIIYINKCTLNDILSLRGVLPVEVATEHALSILVKKFIKYSSCCSEFTQKKYINIYHGKYIDWYLMIESNNERYKAWLNLSRHLFFGGRGGFSCILSWVMNTFICWYTCIYLRNVQDFLKIIDFLFVYKLYTLYAKLEWKTNMFTFQNSFYMPYEYWVTLTWERFFRCVFPKSSWLMKINMFTKHI